MEGIAVSGIVLSEDYIPYRRKKGRDREV